MNTTNEPLVSVVTPVYNGETYLGECIESVLGQTYQNWEYIILNNCSTDRTLEIAESYALKDKRIRIFNTETLLPIMENWNRSLSHISQESKYCKIIHADDLLFPECIEKMVAVAEDHPSVAIVGSYGIEGSGLTSSGLPYPSEFFSGKKICQWTLKRKIYPFTRPSSLLLRSDVIRKRTPFYSGSKFNTDVAVLYKLLRDYDFGFVHQVLTFVRKHENSVTSTIASPDKPFLLSNLDLFTKFGPEFLNPDEYRKLSKQKWNAYYRYLSHNLFQLRDKKFWDYHKNGLQQIGYKFSIMRLIITSLIEILGNSKSTAKIIWATMKILLTHRGQNPHSFWKLPIFSKKS